MRKEKKAAEKKLERKIARIGRKNERNVPRMYKKKGIKRKKMKEDKRKQLKKIQ